MMVYLIALNQELWLSKFLHHKIRIDNTTALHSFRLVDTEKI